jgi:GNAT superfamily N-acetyltransferase
MNVHVRHATLEDCAVALELLRRFFQEEGFTTSPERMEAPLRELITDARSAVLLAWEGAAAVGVATVTSSVGIEQGGRYAELEDLYVLPDWRGKGLAGQLIEEAKQWCRQQGFPLLEVVVTAESQEAHDLLGFYRARGFTPTGRTILQAELLPGR